MRTFTFAFLMCCWLMYATAFASNLTFDEPAPPPDEPIVKERDFTGRVIPLKIIIHPSDEEMHKAFNSFYGFPDSSPVWGWYGIHEGVCEIHVLELKSVNNDPRMWTWGHELAHCVYGRYHK